MSARSFSGTHAYREECARFSVALDWHGELHEDDVARVAEQWASKVTASLDERACPRCHDPLAPERTAGSRVTSCRCIPICPACGADEANQVLLGRPYSRIWEWPISKGHRTRRANKIAANSHASTGTLTASWHILTEDGVSQVDLTARNGGWAQYGTDDEGGVL